MTIKSSNRPICNSHTPLRQSIISASAVPRLSLCSDNDLCGEHSVCLSVNLQYLDFCFAFVDWLCLKKNFRGQDRPRSLLQKLSQSDYSDASANEDNSFRNHIR